MSFGRGKAIIVIVIMEKERNDIMIKFYIDDWGKIFKVNEVEGGFKVEGGDGESMIVKNLEEAYLKEEIFNEEAEFLMHKQYELQCIINEVLNKMENLDFILLDENIEYIGE